jgi:hypothetical protein
MALFLASFFVSAAAASAEARSRQKLADARAAASGSSRAMISKRFNQPLPSPPVSPCKSNKSYSSYGGYGERTAMDEHDRLPCMHAGCLASGGR